ncbi:hypothetical protein HN588_04725 [Candidatus Bathyarchaeota archaeon]|nr:hypothetical protein [Candidatus Bathyarchaeota archaeon]
MSLEESDTPHSVGSNTARSIYVKPGYRAILTNDNGTKVTLTENSKSSPWNPLTVEVQASTDRPDNTIAPTDQWTGASTKLPNGFHARFATAFVDSSGKPGKLSGWSAVKSHVPGRILEPSMPHTAQYTDGDEITFTDVDVQKTGKTLAFVPSGRKLTIDLRFAMTGEHKDPQRRYVLAIPDEWQSVELGKSGSNTNGEFSVSFTAPKTPGTYHVQHASFDTDSKAPVKIKKDPLSAIATVVVTPSPVKVASLGDTNGVMLKIMGASFDAAVKGAKNIAFLEPKEKSRLRFKWAWSGDETTPLEGIVGIRNVFSSHIDGTARDGFGHVDFIAPRAPGMYAVTISLSSTKSQRSDTQGDITTTCLDSTQKMDHITEDLSQALALVFVKGKPTTFTNPVLEDIPTGPQSNTKARWVYMMLLQSPQDKSGVIKKIAELPNNTVTTLVKYDALS